MDAWDTFSARSTADEVLAVNDVRDKRMVVTGDNTGLGYETARALVGAGAQVILACRDASRGQLAVDKVLAKYPDGQASLGLVDLGSLRSVRAFVQAREWDTIDVLICNAGLFNGKYRQSHDGYEQTVAVCHLGHFLLTTLLLPKLLAGGAGRVVMVSSEAHRRPPTLDFDRFPLPPDQYRAMVAYGQAKLCNVLFANELQRRYADEGLSACSLHPGNMVTTDIGRGSVVARAAMALVSPFTKNAKQGAGTIALCASHPNPADVGGRYFADCRPKRNSQGSSDQQAAQRLWELSESWVGL